MVIWESICLLQKTEFSLSIHLSDDLFEHAAARKRRFAGERFVQDAAHCVDLATHVDALTPHVREIRDQR